MYWCSLFSLPDSLSSLHQDSAYDSTDPDTEGYKGSTEMHAFHSDTEEKTLEHFQMSSSPDGKQTSKPFIRRCSEPTIVLSKGARNQPALARSQTDIDFYGHHLAKQISDECVLFGAGKRLLPGHMTMYISSPAEHSQRSKDCSCCSCSSLESTFSSASESSIHSVTPIVSSSIQSQAIQRKLSFPCRSKPHGTGLGEFTKKRSQSMKASNSRSKITFSRSGVSKQGQRALRHSQTLPELLPHNRNFLVSRGKPRRLSSEEVFHQVDSRILNNPPCYEQAIQDNAHTALLLCSQLTVDAARCLSKHTCSQSTFPTAKPTNSCSMIHSSCWGGERSDVLAASSTQVSQQGTKSETKSEESNTSRAHSCSQQLLETLDVRESYVWHVLFCNIYKSAGHLSTNVLYFEAKKKKSF